MLISTTDKVRGTLLLLLGALTAGCTPGEPPSDQSGLPSGANASPALPAPDFNSDFDTELTIAEIMDAMVMRDADVVWNAVAYVSTEDGYIASGPETDEDWLDLRYAAMSLAEATNNLLIPGRHANRPGTEAIEGELAPEAIDELIESQHDVWTAFAGSLRAAAEQTIDAIDARDLDRVLDVGGAIDEACESCHVVFWYPNQQLPQ